MQNIFSKFASGAAWLSIALAISGFLWGFVPGQASAGFCSATSCSFSLTNSNFTGAGAFGTVTLKLSSDVVTIDVILANAYRIVATGFPGAVGFADNRGGGLTIQNFKSPNVAPSPYSGFLSVAPDCKSNDCHWNQFGYANDAAGITGPKRPDSLQELSFEVSKGTSITDVHQLLQRFIPSGGNSPAYFTVDACMWETRKNTCGLTGLFAVTKIPEPGSLALLASGLLVLGLLRWKRVI